MTLIFRKKPRGGWKKIELREGAQAVRGPLGGATAALFCNVAKALLFLPGNNYFNATLLKLPTVGLIYPVGNQCLNIRWACELGK